MTWRIASAALVASLCACAPASVDRYDRDALAVALESEPGRTVAIGEFPLRKGAVVDGDTIKVGGLDSSLRLLGIDTEETFKSDKARRAYERGWEDYWTSAQAAGGRPPKIPTPLGEDAKKWAQEFFNGVQRVRLERDHPRDLRGRYGRILAYVFVERDGQWVNYNVEAVRAGMSPYFTKYGYSRRFHEEFRQAEAEAREAKRGIWAPGAEAYSDYDVRLAWWSARAEFIAGFEDAADEADDHFVLTHHAVVEDLEARVGEEVSVLAVVGSIYEPKGRGPWRVMLGRRRGDDLPLTVWDRAVLDQSRLADYVGEPVIIRARVNEWTPPSEGRRSPEPVLQLEIRHARQVRVPAYEPPGAPDPDEDAPADFFL